MSKETPKTPKPDDQKIKIEAADMVVAAESAAVFTTPVESWKQLTELIERYERDTSATWLFRGVTNSTYTLRPRIGREGARKDSANGEDLPYDQGEENKAFDLFMRTAMPYLTYEPKSDTEWMAVAQHYGLPTRLLDWTESPLIAAYFAMEKAGTGGNPAIYVIEAPPRMRDEEGPFMIEEVKTYYPPYISPRIQVQRSVFTVHNVPNADYEPKSVQKWEFPRGRPSFELKLIIDRCGFNRGSLFPDLQGLAQHVGWCYKWGRSV